MKPDIKSLKILNDCKISESHNKNTFIKTPTLSPIFLENILDINYELTGYCCYKKMNIF